MILCDTGVLFCLVDPDQPQHRAYRRAIASRKQPLVTTWSCLTEAMYLASRRKGWKMQKQLGDLVLDALVVLYTIDPSHIARILQLMEKYRDRPMDFADASLVLLAEQTNYRQIFTLDSDFLFYRIGDRDSFEILSA